ncbi:glycosyltransferase [Paenibacillaceae bacterium]|nr:glycosyltransferase [Paenibacillaceae bacterium]
MVDVILVLSIILIWIAVLQSIVIMSGAIRFIFRQNRKGPVMPNNLDDYPTVTVMVPAHNEELVIAFTVRNILRLNYPADKVQLIVVADNCSDQTAARVHALLEQPEFKERNVTVMQRKGTGGKSGALNDALELVTGEWICIYDADAAPQSNALLFLMQKAMEDPERYGAVFGRNKARNRDQNFLTKFINLELVTAQRILHTGLWELFKLGTIPGTNYIMKTSLMRDIGGWDVKALTEDTAISFDIMSRGQLIALSPYSEAYQQEPENLKVYMKQRERWAQGNFSVVMENIHHLFGRANWRIKLHVLYYAASYFFFLMAIIVSDILFVTNIVYMIIGLFDSSIVSPFQFEKDVYVYLIIAWALMYYIYVLQINLALSSDIGQSNTRNFILSCVSYFTYAQLFLLISLRALYSMFMEKVTGTRKKWYKTQRF